MEYRDSEDLAIQHVDWFLTIIRPIIIEHMIHGYKHGYEKAIENSLNILKKVK